MSPTTYPKKEAEPIISYGTAECFLGRIIIAATDKGVCAIEFRDTADLPVTQLQQIFPRARIKEAGPDFSSMTRKVVEFIDAPVKSIDIPLDIQGTDFQQQVWNILRQIEPGKTLSYTEVAERSGNPSAVRAVASAIAANKLAVVIPCHRVIAKNGKLAGYRWGIERKRQLLEREKDCT